MRPGPGKPVWIRLTAPARWLIDQIKRWRSQPPPAGVREPRRPKPTLPAAAVALAEPRTARRRWIKLITRHDGEPT